MKLATLRTDKPDGELVVVSRDLTGMHRVRDIVADACRPRSMTGRACSRCSMPAIGAGGRQRLRSGSV